MLELPVVVLLAAGAGQPLPPLRQEAAARPAQAESKGAASAVDRARDGDAYYQFLLGRHLESNGEIDNAIKAYRRAALADPRSAEIPAELAGLYARQNNAPEAIASAEAALKLDPDNFEAHRVLGMVYAALAHADERASLSDAAAAKQASLAIKHLEAAAHAPGRLPDSGIQLQLARLYVATRQDRQAIPLLEEFVGREGDIPDAIDLLADAYGAAGRTADRTALLARASETDPQFYPLLAESYEHDRRWRDAASAYEKALRFYPANKELKTRYAIALLSEPDVQAGAKAKALLADVLKASPNDGRTLYLMAQAQRAMKDLDGAEQTARRLTQLMPTSATGPEVLAEIYAERGEPDKVIALLQPLVSPDQAGGKGIPAREMTPLLTSLAFAYEDRGEFDRAVSVFEQARRQAPGDPAVGIYLAQATLEAGRPQAALDLIKEVRAGGVVDARLERLEAEALRRTGRLDQGIAILTKALAARSGDAAAFLALAELCTDGERYDDALGVLRDAEQKFPDDFRIVFQEGATLERARRYAEAEAAFRRVIAGDPLNALALNYLGYMMADRGDRLDEAIGYIKRALAIEPRNGAFLDSLGWAYFKQNKLDLAEENLRAAAERRVRDSAVQEHYGDLLEKRGRYQEAVAAWNRALAGDGDQVDRSAIEKKVRAASGKIKSR